jgi:hypothetical protein
MRTKSGFFIGQALDMSSQASMIAELGTLRTVHGIGSAIARLAWAILWDFRGTIPHVCSHLFASRSCRFGGEKPLFASILKGSRYVDMEGATGSIPVPPTI